MTTHGDATLQGAPPATVRAAIGTGEALPGTRGFAGEVDGSIVRDVLGRYPLFAEADAPRQWSFDPRELDDPRPVPAGVVRDESGERRRWTLPAPDPVADLETGTVALREALTTSLDGLEGDDIAVAFSGGVDSAALAARVDAPLFTVGFPGSPDLEAARDAAAALGRAGDLTVVELDHDRLEAAIPQVAGASGRRDPMSVSIALPLYVAGEAAAAAGYERLALGQGADELLGGYDKVANAPSDPRVAAATVRAARREVVESLPDQLERDVLAVRAARVEPVAPYLHDEVVLAALRLDGGQLLGPGGERKWPLRRAVRDWLPDRLAFRKKRALQYGSRVSREIDRLARQSGFKRRQDDHVERYVDSLCDED